MGNGTPDDGVGLNHPDVIRSTRVTRIRQYIYWGRETVFKSVSARLAAVIQSRLVRDEEGATAVEYGLIVGLIAVVIIAAVALLGDTLFGLFNGIAGELPEVGTP